MKKATLKAFTAAHSWLGLATGMALFIAFYAGALTVFFHELKAWDDYLPVTAVQAQPARADALIEQVLAADPAAARAFHLHLAEPGHHGEQLYWFETLANGNVETHGYELAQNGALRELEPSGTLAGFVYRLHYTAGLPRSWGLYVLGVVALLYGLALFTGLLVFVPDFFKNLFIIRSPGNRKRFWLDTHNVVGVISLPWHFMFAWSSVLLAFGAGLVIPFQWLVFDGNVLATMAPQLGLLQPPGPAGATAGLLPVADLVARAQEQLPGLLVSELRFTHGGDLNGAVQLVGVLDQSQTLVSRATVMLSAVNGDVLAVVDPRTATFGSSLFNGLIALHLVSYGGFTAKWAYFFLGLAGAFLCYSGNLLWIETRRRRRQEKQRSDALLLAKLNSGVCIGCIAGISAAFLISRAMIGLDGRSELTELAYYVVFFSAVGWCLLRPVAAGARDLLYAAAALTLLIPVADMVVIDRPIWRNALSGEWALLMVELLALMGALAYWQMGQAVERRARQGPPNSVWAQSLKNPSFAVATAHQPKI